MAHKIEHSPYFGPLNLQKVNFDYKMTPKLPFVDKICYKMALWSPIFSHNLAREKCRLYLQVGPNPPGTYHSRIQLILYNFIIITSRESIMNQA